MSDAAARDIIKRAISDDNFRDKLSTEFETTVEEYQLTEEELNALRRLDWTNPLPKDARVEGSWVHIYNT